MPGPSSSSFSSSAPFTPSAAFNPFHPFPMPLDDDPVLPTLPTFTNNWAPSPASSHQDASYPGHTFTTRHLILLHHAETSVDMFMLGPGLLAPMVDLCVSWAIEAPYTLDQLLALSADHMALKQPDKAASYRHTATELQTRGLTLFNMVVKSLETEEDLEKTCIPRFLFASLLSVHAMFETFTYYRISFHTFIDRFTESVNLHRGVRAIIKSTYHIIIETSLRPYFEEVTAASESHQGNECDGLLEFITSSDLGPSAHSSCVHAVNTLQWAFNIQNALPPLGKARAGTAWPVLLTTEFVDTLKKRQPEALIILAYYGVILHRCRESWIFGDAGAFLIHLIADYLGRFWEHPMQWPLEILRIET